MEETKDLRKLTKYIRIWLALHIISLSATFLIDLLACAGPETREKVPFAQWLISGPWDVFCKWEEAIMENNGDPYVNFVSSLFVIWTVITAILIFYIERKENQLCGIRHWVIVTNRLYELEIYAVVGILSAEVGLLLVENIVLLSRTLLCLGVSLWATVTFMFVFVFEATDKDRLKEEFKKFIKKEAGKRKDGESDKADKDQKKKKDKLEDFFTFYRKADELDFDYLLEIMKEIFDEVEIRRLVSMSSEEYIIKSDFMYKLCVQVGHNSLKNQFVENFINEIVNKGNQENKEGRKKAAELLLFPLLEANDESCVDGLGVIDDETIRNEALIDCYVLAAYFNQNPGYDYIVRMLKNHMENYALWTLQNRGKCEEFWKEYKSYCRKKDETKEFNEDFLNDVLNTFKG